MPHRNKTNEEKVRSFRTAKDLTENIKNVCRNCEICINNKTRGQDKLGLMSHLGPAKSPFETMSMNKFEGSGGSRSLIKYLHL